VGLADYFPWYAWVAIGGLVGTAGLALFVPPTVGAVIGLTPVQHVAAVAGIELIAALGVTGILLRYRTDPSERPETDEWRYDP
jgi:hypothetical protein